MVKKYSMQISVACRKRQVWCVALFMEVTVPYNFQQNWLLFIVWQPYHHAYPGFFITFTRKSSADALHLGFLLFSSIIVIPLCIAESFFRKLAFQIHFSQSCSFFKPHKLHINLFKKSKFKLQRTQYIDNLYYSMYAV